MNSKKINTLPKNLKLALILGSENKGIKKLSLDKCDFRVTIQTKKSKLVDSLNVAHAAAIVLYEVNTKELPKFYNDIDETFDEIKSLLSRGVKDRKSNFHYTTLVQLVKPKPQARTVIFRHFDSEKFHISIHSDYRSKKIKEILLIKIFV